MSKGHPGIYLFPPLLPRPPGIFLGHTGAHYLGGSTNVSPREALTDSKIFINDSWKKIPEKWLSLCKQNLQYVAASSPFFPPHFSPLSNSYQ